MGLSQKNNDVDPASGPFGHCIVQLDDQEKLLHSEKCINAKSQIYIDFSDLCYTVPHRKGKEKDILQDISGYFRPGNLTGIIGPSGAGKTSLLRILSGLRASKLKGSINVNGAPRNIDELRKSACYIPQEFALLPWITTRETLRIAARLKLGQPRNDLELVINEVANKLGLSNCMDTMVDHLSGGEKKRLSIGVEIITNPALMLLDEPTSGLDSVSSNQVVGLLKSIAKTGCTVVCAIHQPNSQMIELFDDIMVLAEGKQFYCGPREDILETFTEVGYGCPPFYNIAEFVIEVVTGQRGGDLELLSQIGKAKCSNIKLQYNFPKKSNNFNALDTDVNEMTDGTTSNSVPARRSAIFSKEENITKNVERHVSEWEQQKVLLLRALICIQRDNTMTKLRLVAHIIVALLLGLVFYHFGDDAVKVQSNIACIFFFLLFLFFANAMPAVQMFPIEAAVFLREHLNNWYSLKTYYIAKVVTDIPLQILCPSCFLLIGYCMTGQPFECERFMRAWLICILITILAQSFGILTGAAFNTHAGCFLVPALNIPMFLFAGFFLKLNEVPTYLRLFCWISYFRYAFEGILQAIYDNDRGVLKCSEGYCPARNPSRILSEMGMPTASFTTIIIVLISWILCLHLTIYSVLRWKLSRAIK